MKRGFVLTVFMLWLAVLPGEASARCFLFFCSHPHHHYSHRHHHAHHHRRHVRVKIITHLRHEQPAGANQLPPINPIK